MATAALAVATVLGQVTVAAAAPSHLAGQRIVVTTTTCAPRWYAPNAGRARFTVDDRSRFGATMYLFHPVSGTIVAHLTVKAGQARLMTVRLRAGRHYVWACNLAGRPSRVSETETVPLDPNHGGTGPRVVPVTRDELVAPMKAYRAYVARQLTLLTGQVTALTTDVDGGDLSAAEADWLTAHRTWLAIGQDDGAYSAFGNLGLRIDGTAAGLPGGTASTKFTGFHKIELDLWGHSSTVAARGDVAALTAALAALHRHSIASWFPLSVASVSGLPLRTHEVLEDALRDTLSGNDDYGSGTGLASLRSDVTAVRELLTLLAPVITPRAAHLVGRARSELNHLTAAVNAGHSNGSWIAVDALPRTLRETIDGDTGAALEILAPVPDLLTIGKS